MASKDPRPSTTGTSTSLVTTSFSTVSNVSDAFSAASVMLSEKTRKALGDSKYDKRKAGALEVEAIVKSLVAQQRRGGGSCEDAVKKLCLRLRTDFICSSYPDQRKGGLIAMAAVAVGLGTEVGACLDALLEPVLKCFDDNEARVRYFAAESMYNICKVARSYLLQSCEDRFNLVFTGLCKLSADNDPEVRYGAGLLDRLLKVIVAESESFRLDAVVPLFQRFLMNKNPFIRQLLVSWITTLDAVPDLDVVRRLPSLLDGLLDMLSDVNKSIRDSADHALQVFLQEIADASIEKRKSDLIPSTYEILLKRRSDATRQVRLVSITWLAKFVSWGGDALVDRFADFLKAVIDAVSEQDDTEKGEIVAFGKKLDFELQEIARKTEAGKQVDEKGIMKVALEGAVHVKSTVRETSVNWVCLLLDIVPARVTPALDDDILPVMISRLDDESDVVVGLGISAISRVARNSGSCDRILSDVMNKFSSDRNLLEERGSYIIRKLCTLLRPKTVYLVLARIVDSKQGEDINFSAIMVQSLNVILLTTNELGDLRALLKSAWLTPEQAEDLSKAKRDSRLRTIAESRTGIEPPLIKSSLDTKEDAMQTFKIIFKAWSHNPVSALCLSLLAGAYRLAGRLIEILAESEVTVDLLVDADRLVRLLESPVFLHLRMQLLRSDKNFEPELLKALFGLLMILPQRSEAFKTLEARLSAVTGMHMALAGGKSLMNKSPRNGFPSSNNEMNGSNNNVEDTDPNEAIYDDLLDEFARVQAYHAKYRSETFATKSLVAT